MSDAWLRELARLLVAATPRKQKDPPAIGTPGESHKEVGRAAAEHFPSGQ